MNNQIDQTEGYLTGRLLVSMPMMKQDSVFAKTVIYVVSHNVGGAIGIVVNQTLNNVSCSSIFDSFNIERDAVKKMMPVHFGGPVEAEKGFILHSSDYSKDVLIATGEKMALSSNLQILKAIATGHGPKNSIFALGYAGWSGGQLEIEMVNNNWLTVPFSDDIVFSADNSHKWDEAMHKMGFDACRLSYEAGSA